MDESIKWLCLVLGQTVPQRWPLTGVLTPKRMKPKLVAIIVITVLAVSMALTVAAAINQAANGDFTGAASVQQDGQDSGDGSLVRSFKFVCPFH